MSKKADEKVMELRKELLKKKEALLDSETPVYIAGEYFRPDLNSHRGEFQVVAATYGQLLNGLKSLMLHETASLALNMDPKHLGFTMKEWLLDFKTRKSVLDRSENLIKVDIIEAKLKDLLSQAQLREIGINDIEDAVSAL